jgi:hypothetical protein
MLRTIPAALLELQVFAQNYHENFNEVNREVIFSGMLRWMRSVQR